MNHDEIAQIKNLITNLDEKMVQQRSSHHSDLLREIIAIKKDIETNTQVTENNSKMIVSLSAHPIFKAWDDGKILFKVIKWGGIALIGVSAVLVAIKNGANIVKDVLKI